MKIELVVIGNEVLTGFTVNTNASFIGKELFKAGYFLGKQTILPDTEDVLAEGLGKALHESDLVITTGGLGPTLDDITRKIVARLFKSDFIFSPDVANDLELRYGKDFPTITDQATVPEKAKILMNSVGTAPGFIFEESGKAMILLPGVPSEMKQMMQFQALPYILERFSLKSRVYKQSLYFLELSEHALDPALRELSMQYPHVDFGIYPSLGFLSLSLGIKAQTEKDAMRELSQPLSTLQSLFATNCYASENGLLEEAVHHAFVENQWTLSIAESCTGGQAAARLTKLPGASDYFLGSVVPYSNQLKTGILGIPKELIEKNGAVSPEVVAKMAEGVQKISGSDFSLAVTGIAGPAGGTLEKPVGTVWCAVCRKGEPPYIWKLQGRGTREMIIERSVNSLFSHLLLYIKKTSLL